MTDDLTLASGSISMTTGTGAKAITNTGSGDLTVSSGGNTIIESVTFNGGAVSTMTSLTMSGSISTTGNGAKAIENTGSGDLTVSSGGNTKIESVTFNGGAVSTMTTLDMSGHLTNTGGNIYLTNNGAKAITKSGTGDLTVSSDSTNTLIESVTFNGGAVS